MCVTARDWALRAAPTKIVPVRRAPGPGHRRGKSKQPPLYFFISSGARGVFVAGSVGVVLSFSDPVGVAFSGVRSDVSELPGWPGGLVDAGVSPGPLVGVSPAIAGIASSAREVAAIPAIVVVRIFFHLG